MHGRESVQLPSAEQRQRILELLTSLAPHHTKECTRSAQPLYTQQAHLRYAPLVGHQLPYRSSFNDWNPLSDPEDDHLQLVRREIANLPAGSRDHKYFIAINLCPRKFYTLFYYVLTRFTQTTAST